MYESWKSHMEIYIQGKDHGWIILNLVEKGPLIWPNMEQEDGTVRLKTYEELSDKEKLQVDCDLKDTNIVLQGLPLDVYSLINHHKVSKEIWDRVKLLMQGTSLSKQERECKLYDEFDKFSYVMGETLAPRHLQQYPNTYPTNLTHTQPSVPQNAYPPLTIPQQPQVEFPQLDSGLAVPTFLPGDNPIACMNKAMVKQSLSSAIIVKGKGTWLDSVLSQREEGMQHDLEVADGQVAQTITHNAAFQTDDLDAYDFECDDISSVKAVLMVNLLSCDSDVLSKSSNKKSEEPSTSNTPVKIEVPSELPKWENADLKAQIQEKVFANAALKNELRKLKGKTVIDNVVSKPHATTIAPGMFKLNLEPHTDYIKHSRDHADTLREIVKNARTLSPLDSNLDSAYGDGITSIKERRSDLSSDGVRKLTTVSGRNRLKSDLEDSTL
ncbi:hypothetical protein Tco_1316796 [Tanacetum coccineum]